MQIQALCGWLKPANYKPKAFTKHVSYLQEVLKQWVSIHLDPISYPSRDIKSLAVPIGSCVGVCCICGYLCVCWKSEKKADVLLQQKMSKVRCNHSDCEVWRNENPFSFFFSHSIGLIHDRECKSSPCMRSSKTLLWVKVSIAFSSFEARC